MKLEEYENRFQNKDDIKFLNVIQDIAKELYSGIKRKNGVDEYFNHIEDVIRILIATNCVDKIILATAYFHDVLEENAIIKNHYLLANIIKNKIKENEHEEEWLKCIDEITYNVDILTFRDENYNKLEKPYYKALYLNRIVNTSVYYQDALIVKIADRIANVLEFYKNGEIDYAKKYFTRGEILYGACYKHLEHYKNINKTMIDMKESYQYNEYITYFNNLSYKINDTKKHINK